MQTYLVGGAVRDTLLGLPVRERDWLVTQVTAEQLEAQGFQRVGRQFAVFLHPKTHEEHALPRGPAPHPGSDSDQVIEDLKRRDLTINALAMDKQQRLIDPLNGRQDLQQRLLRHTPAFTQDPIRILRLARFAARYHALGFRVAPETQALVRHMTAQGQLDHLVAERVFAEFSKAMQEAYPHIFIQQLHQLQVLDILLPEVARLFGVPQPPQHHPEIDTGLHTLMVLQQTAQLSLEPEVRMAALLHDVGKGVSPVADWPQHIAHEQHGVPLIRVIARRLRLPNPWRDLAVMTSRYHLHAHRAYELKPQTLFKLFHGMDAMRRPQRFTQYLSVCEADMRGRSGFEQREYPQARFLQGALEAARQVDVKRLQRQIAPGPQLAERIKRARIAAIAAYKRGAAKA